MSGTSPSMNRQDPCTELAALGVEKKEVRKVQNVLGRNSFPDLIICKGKTEDLQCQRVQMSIIEEGIISGKLCRVDRWRK